MAASKFGAAMERRGGELGGEGVRGVYVLLACAEEEGEGEEHPPDCGQGDETHRRRAIPAGQPPSSLSGRGGGGGTDRDEPGGFACFVSVAAPHIRPRAAAAQFFSSLYEASYPSLRLSQFFTVSVSPDAFWPNSWPIWTV
jgi:hypothetical protein